MRPPPIVGLLTVSAIGVRRKLFVLPLQYYCCSDRLHRYTAVETQTKMPGTLRCIPVYAASDPRKLNSILRASSHFNKWCRIQKTLEDSRLQKKGTYDTARYSSTSNINQKKYIMVHLVFNSSNMM